MKSFKGEFLCNKKILSITIPIILIIWSLFFIFVDLTPEVGQDFFFSKDSKIYKENKEVARKFPFDGNQILLGLPDKDITSEKYINRIKRISDALSGYKGIKRVVSMTHGPSDPEDVLDHPLWKRLVAANSKDVTFISIYLEDQNNSKTIKQIEDIIKEYEKVNIPIKIAGIPYFREQMKRNLKRDMSTFLKIAIILCSIVILIVNRSFFLMILSVIVSLTAAACSLLVLSFLDQPVGILTANLMVIAYVLTQSHFIFYSSNFQNLKSTKKALIKTLPASFWSMATTLLGFAGLIFVEAKPLVQLGIGGTVATLSAFLISYLLLPSLLNFQKTKNKNKINKFIEENSSLGNKKIWGSSFVILYVGATLILGFGGLTKLNTDPSLLSYFKKESEIYKQLSFLNDHGGSNILRVVLKRKNGKPLDDEKSYKELWELQEQLKSHEKVGTVISLPVLLKEADTHWLGQFLTWDWILELLSTDMLGNIGKGFVSEDHSQTVLLLKMIESKDESKKRLTIIDELEKVVDTSSFKWLTSAGPYYLQGRLAESVKMSLITGVSLIVGIFFFVVFWISKSFLLSACISLCLSSIVIMTFGLMGVTGVPLDLISSPGISITLGITIDGFIHLIRAVKEEGGVDKIEAWKEGLDSQMTGLLTSSFTIIVGFSAFIFSSFLPSQRFGGIILLGALLSLPLVLCVIPTLFPISRLSGFSRT